MRALILSAILPVAHVLHAQTPPSLVWQGCYGGSGYESPALISSTQDGGIILACMTQSNNGQVSGNHGANDIWVAKLDEAGGIQWQRCYGGSGDDYPAGIHPLPDGGYILTGGTASNDGDVSGNHGNTDVWVLKIDAQGDIEWQRAYGGSGYEACQRSLYSPTYGLTLIGKSDVAGGDVTSNFGSRDAWLLRLNDAGDILWQRSYGGTLLDEGKDLAPAPDGGLFAIAQTSSNNGQVQGNHGGYELWAFRLDATGEILWQRCIGGSGDEWPNRIIHAANGDWLISGFTYSNDGDISGYHSEGDAWLTRVSNDNQLVFSTVYGGSSGEGFGPLLELGDGSILVAGSTSSSDGDVSGQPTASDAWLLNLAPNGEIVWQTLFGGSGDEGAASIVGQPATGFVFASRTDSNDGDVTGNHGSFDAWVYGITPLNSIGDVTDRSTLHAFPNPACEFIHLQLPGSWNGAMHYSLFMSCGAVAQAGRLDGVHGTLTIDVSELSAGSHWLVVQGQRGIAYGEVTIER